MSPTVAAAAASISTTTTTTTTTIRLPTSYVDDPTALSYKARWSQHLQRQQEPASSLSSSSHTIYGLCFYQHRPHNNPNSVAATAVRSSRKLQRHTNKKSNKSTSTITYLVGCASTGHVYVWQVPTWSTNGTTLLHYDPNDVGTPWLELILCTNNNNSNNNNNNNTNHYNGCLYSLQLVQLRTTTTTTSDDDDDDWFLVVSGDGGVYFIDWTKDVVPYLVPTAADDEDEDDKDENEDDDDDDDDPAMVKNQMNQMNQKQKLKKKRSEPLTVHVVRHLKPHVSSPGWWGEMTVDNNDSSVSAGRVVEINDFALDNVVGADNNDHHNNCEYVYGAAGDAFGCYKWHLERGEVVATYRPKTIVPRTSSSNSNNCYLHTVNTTMTMTTSNGSGAGGGLRHAILLGGEGGTLELWDTHADQRIDSWSMGTTTTTTNNDGTGGTGSSSSSGWVASSAIAGDWWHVGGGCSGESTGFVASIHGPTRSLVTNRTTSEVIQCLQYDVAATMLYSVGNESLVSYWHDPCTLRQRHKIGCSTGSGYATAVCATTGLVAVAGTGSIIDLFEHQSSSTTAVPFCQLHTERN